MKMRTIKFRAWEHLTRRMLNWKNIRGIKDGKFTFVEVFNPKYFTFMQFTGLKDKNGKEIYEGDVIRIRNNNCLIKFEYGMFFIVMKSYGVVPINRIIKEAEIMGNIYENPELLKEAEDENA